MGGFKMKGWVSSGLACTEYCESAIPIVDENTKKVAYEKSTAENTSKILGIHWNPNTDCFHFSVRLNCNPK